MEIDKDKRLSINNINQTLDENNSMDMEQGNDEFILQQQTIIVNSIKDSRIKKDKKLSVNRNLLLFGKCSLWKIIILIFVIAIVLGLLDIIIIMSERKYQHNDDNKQYVIKQN